MRALVWAMITALSVACGSGESDSTSPSNPLLGPVPDELRALVPDDAVAVVRIAPLDALEPEIGWLAAAANGNARRDLRALLAKWMGLTPDQLDSSRPVVAALRGTGDALSWTILASRQGAYVSYPEPAAARGNRSGTRSSRSFEAREAQAFR